MTKEIHIVSIKDVRTGFIKQFCLHSYAAIQLWRELREHQYKFDYQFLLNGEIKENPEIWSEFPHHPSGREPMIWQWNYILPYHALDHC